VSEPAVPSAGSGVPAVPRPPEHLVERLVRFRDALAGVGRLGVAFSGGVDSSVLLALALRELGPDRVLAVTGVSPSLAARDRSRAADVARHLGARLLEVRTHEIDRADYRRNGPDRCYFCKDELFSVITDELVARHGLDAVAYGENADDALRPDRPGAGAATAHRVLRPLADAGLDKSAVRELGSWLGVPTAQTPASPCLASRIPHHSEVTAEKLAQVEHAEDAVLALGVSEVRVRHHGDVARIEVLPDDLATVLQARAHLVGELRRLGFRHVTVDLAGLQSGLFTLEALGLRSVGS
jgi:pyridinium-3,5-biscarboxylic acid mononucleotide sulfurtransferase